jgi:hypothetical protein
LNIVLKFSKSLKKLNINNLNCKNVEGLSDGENSIINILNGNNLENLIIASEETEFRKYIEKFYPKVPLMRMFNNFITFCNPNESTKDEYKKVILFY